VQIFITKIVCIVKLSLKAFHK